MDEPPKHPDVAAMFSALLDATDLNAAGLARKLEITPQAVSNYIVGRNEPGRKMIAAIIRAFPHINAAWLATGVGEPFPNGGHGTKPAAPAPTETPAPAQVAPVLDSGPATVEHATGIMLREQMADQIAELKTDKSELRVSLTEANDEIKRLRAILISLGKSPDGPDAAGSFVPVAPRNPIGFGAAEREARAAEFNEFVEAMLGQELVAVPL